MTVFRAKRRHVMSIQGIDHINIGTARLAETITFFEGLGLAVGSRPPFDFPGAWLYSGDRAIVHLVELTEAKAASETAALDHFAFGIQDYDGMKHKLDAAGVEYRALAVPGAPVRQIFLRDPNGVTIELNCREPRPAD
jgi:catechol 2,3-dioxygenase-like lactoylglutathione lyase family enzyme